MYKRQAEQEAEAIAGKGARTAVDAGLAAEARIVAPGGSPWCGIRRVAIEAAAELIVCGSRGLGAFSRAALGSTSSGLLHHAGRPVLVVPVGAGDLSGPLVIGYDGSDGARTAVARAGQLLGGRDAVVVNVWESMIRHPLSGRALRAMPADEFRGLTRDVDEYLRAVAVEVAEEGAAVAREHGLDARPETVEATGAAWHGLLAVARSSGAAAVVAGSRGHGGLASALLGSVSSGLVHNADLPVLVIPDPPAGNH